MLSMRKSVGHAGADVRPLDRSGSIIAGLVGPVLAALAFSASAANGDAASGCTAAKPRLADPSAKLVATPEPKPVAGVPWIDPQTGACIVRATDHAQQPPEGFARNDYSRRQPMNTNNSLLLVASMNGFWHVYDAAVYTHVTQLPGMAGDAEPQWHPTDPDLLFYLPNNGLGMKLLELNVRTGLSRVVADFGARLKTFWPDAAAAWTKSEGSPSADARYWCFMVDDAKWTSLGVFTWDAATDSIIGTYATRGDRPDHVSMSPSGKYCVVSSNGPRGTVAFTRDFSEQRQLLHRSEHSDLAFDAHGDDVYVSVDYQSKSGELFMTKLSTGARTTLLPTYVNGTSTALHVSGKAFRKRGWAVVSTFAQGGTRVPQWLHGKVLAVQLTANPKIFVLANHRTVENGYWTSPVASVNRDFTRVTFNSNWGVASKTDVDTYVVHLPVDAFGPTTPGR